MTKTINTESFIEGWEGERCLWDVNSVIHTNLYEKAKSRKKLAEQFSVTGTVKSCSCYYLSIFVQYSYLHYFYKIRFSIVNFSLQLQEVLEAIIIVNVIIKQGALNIANHQKERKEKKGIN